MNRLVCRLIYFFSMLIIQLGINMPSVNAFEPFSAVTTARVNMRFTPDTNGELIIKLLPGERLTVIGSDNKWQHVIAVNRNVFGWVFGDYVKKTGHPATDTALNPESSSGKVTTESDSGKLLSVAQQPVTPTVSETEQVVPEPASDLTHHQTDSKNTPTVSAKSQPPADALEKDTEQLIETNIASPDGPVTDFKFTRDEVDLSGDMGLIEKASTVSRLMMKLSLALLSMTAFFLSCSSARMIRSFSDKNRQ